MRHWAYLPRSRESHSYKDVALGLLIAIILGLLQAAGINNFGVFTVKPDLLLISVVIASLSLEFRWAFMLSLFAGVFKDVFSVGPTGMNTLLFCLWSFLIVRLNKQITIDYNLIRIALIFIISFLHNAIIGLILISMGRFIPLGIFLRILFLTSIYTAVVSLLILKFTDGLRPMIYG